MRRSRLLQALLLSLALHAGLGLFLWTRPPRADAPRPEPLQFDVIQVERAVPPRREPPPPPARPPVRPSRRPPAAARPPAEATAARTPEAPGPSAPVSAPAEAPSSATDTPQAVRLYPGPGGLAVSPDLGIGPAVPRGQTWRPGDGPTSGQRLAEERERVHGRVQGFTEDTLAARRVDNGLVDPFFSEMDKAMEKGLSGAPLFSYQGVLKHFFKPGPGTAQALRDVFARTRPSNTELLEGSSRAAGTLHVELELEQSRTGQVLAVKLSVSSGNPLFDAYVLENVPPALASLGPAPEHFAARAHQDTVRSVWGVDGHVSFSRTLKVTHPDALNAGDAAYLSALMALGGLSGNFEETTGEVIVPDLRRPHFDTKARLLRVY